MMHWLEKATPYPDRNFKYHLTFEKKIRYRIHKILVPFASQRRLL